MADRGKASITDASGATAFGPQTDNNEFCYLINRGPNTAYITGDETDAVADTGFNLAVNEAVNTRDLPAVFRNGTFKAICASGETASIYWAIA